MRFSIILIGLAFFTFSSCKEEKSSTANAPGKVKETMDQVEQRIREVSEPLMPSVVKEAKRNSEPKVVKEKDSGEKEAVHEQAEQKEKSTNVRLEVEGVALFYDESKLKGEEPKIPTAEAVPGRIGYVYSPSTGKVIDAREFKPGQVVIDPFSAEEDRYYFRIPEPVAKD